MEEQRRLELKFRFEQKREERARALREQNARQQLNALFNFRAERIERLSLGEPQAATFWELHQDKNLTDKVPSEMRSDTIGVILWIIQKIQERARGEAVEISIRLREYGFTQWIAVAFSEIELLASNLRRSDCLIRFKDGHVVAIADHETHLVLYEVP